MFAFVWWTMDISNIVTDSQAERTRQKEMGWASDILHHNKDAGWRS